MSKYELELICLIRDSRDPAKAMEIAVDVIQRVLSGESEASIMASYGMILASQL